MSFDCSMLHVGINRTEALRNRISKIRCASFLQSEFMVLGRYLTFGYLDP